MSLLFWKTFLTTKILSEIINSQKAKENTRVGRLVYQLYAYRGHI